MTPAYTFTDYWSQGQTITYIIVDITMPPGGSMSLFNLYVALSCSLEDQRLQEQNTRPKTWWEQMKNGVAQTLQCLSS
ncbi:uncharacterized protein LAESUDRAFT_659453 [Laetiporus sulphureus 93-53]|uniref:Uncharacterized protein n=1 Tax=Laetiporus sulphureus 93-53 TaxID=1314785 RepID=A0A165CW09_9APHY|nr:uncharacterized protein LAESUDRAFT_659453 [Laetiporus sulphureus 93-53]KZT03545.1 hypothetical protein LAESUDRAFT_659453 [Laetiporus sulphureus 93-53]